MCYFLITSLLPLLNSVDLSSVRSIIIAWGFNFKWLWLIYAEWLFLIWVQWIIIMIPGAMVYFCTNKTVEKILLAFLVHIHSCEIWIQLHTGMNMLTHWGLVMHICIGNLTIIGSDNGLCPSCCQAIIWSDAGILLIGPWRTNFSENALENGSHFVSASMC